MDFLRRLWHRVMLIDELPVPMGACKLYRYASLRDIPAELRTKYPGSFFERYVQYGPGDWRDKQQAVRLYIPANATNGEIAILVAIDGSGFLSGPAVEWATQSCALRNLVLAHRQRVADDESKRQADKLEAAKVEGDKVFLRRLDEEKARVLAAIRQGIAADMQWFAPGHLADRFVRRHAVEQARAEIRALREELKLRRLQGRIPLQPHIGGIIFGTIVGLEANNA
jgi:hypothetical protein